MNKIHILLILCFTGLLKTEAQTVVGSWKTIDDVTERPKSILEIYKEEGKLHARVVEILVEGKENARCIKCEGPKKDKPIKGMKIIDGLTRTGNNEYGEGKILDPESGKVYRCKLWIDPENPDELKVRGYVAFFYRTQVWKRVSP
jgi:uncharacterized protein (DUF2147 family)